MISSEIEWNKLPFAYVPTDYNLRCRYVNGKWGELEVSSSEHIHMHMSATALHYSQEVFEGMKAFRGSDGKLRLFRWRDNLARLNLSCDGLLMPTVPESLFEKALREVIRLNTRFVPPYGTGASLYVRPLMIGTGARIGVDSSDEFLLVIFVMPVGPYFPTGFKTVDVQMVRDYDRAAPLGTGRLKTGGNYAASLKPAKRAHDEGFKTVIYLDAREKKYIDECGPANFFAIKENKYITPDSTSILQSITNMSLCTLAEDMGLTVERRRVPVEELSEFNEVGACGTAAVITPIRSIQDRETGASYKYDEQPGPWCKKLYERLQAIQYGNQPDKFGWTTEIEG
ncbi:MAG: branched-chain amino acid aminotransferase [Prevotellaceae bacterium]|jgi:branched-chain amino acid aminotransferase|nr:branched-chain amino acid aminotransferase [Prevotellaceae bacterium]